MWAVKPIDIIYCEERCPYHDNVDRRNTEPCLNCPVESYVDYLEGQEEA